MQSCSEEVGGAVEEADEATSVYCERMVKKVKGQRSPEAQSIPKAEAPVADSPVPLQFINALKMKRFTEELKRTVEMDIHDPLHCEACRSKQTELAMDTFIRMKTTQLQSQILERKLQSLLLSRNTICLVGEILKDLPRPSDNPRTFRAAVKAGQLKQLADSS